MSATGVFDFSLPDARLSSKVLEHCCKGLERISAKGKLFKIGITSDPHARWYHADRGYYKSSSTTMRVLAILHFMESASVLEASLIKLFRADACCLNKAPGGEGVNVRRSPAFVYVVFT